MCRVPDSAVRRARSNQDCAADVVFYTIAGGGHSWPGGVPLPEAIVGTTTEDIDATRVMWTFLEPISDLVPSPLRAFP